MLVNSPSGMGMVGIDGLKQWAEAFAGGLAHQIDLVDEHLALDGEGNGRGFITFTLHWKHTKDFFGLKPTGREGTSRRGGPQPGPCPADWASSSRQPSARP